MDEFDNGSVAEAVAPVVRDSPAGVVLVEVGGELDMASVPAVREFVRSRLGDVDRVLVLDLTRVTFLGSTGLGMLLDLRAECGEADVALWLVTGGAKAVRRTLELTDLTHHFSIVDTVAEAR